MIRRGQFDASEAFADAWDARERSVAEHPGVRDLVRVAQSVQYSAVIAPSDEYRLELRERLMAEASQVLVATETKQTRPKAARTVQRPTISGPRRRIVGIAAAAVSTFAVVGTAASSASAVPGDVMYPVKRGLENVQLAMHRDDAARGEFQLQQARERLAEAVALQQAGNTDQLAGSLEDFSDQASAGADELFAAYSDKQGSDDIDTINQFVATASVTLAEMSSAEVPDDAARAFEGAAAVVTNLASEASNLCVACAPADVTDIVASIESIVASEGAEVAPPAEPEAASADPEVQSTPTSPAPPISGSKPTPAPRTEQPATPKAPIVGDLVDSIIDEDEGLIPGLLGGLLGGGR